MRYDAPVKFADRLKQVMLERRPPLTQEALADRVGVTQRAVAGWLQGTIPYPKTLNRICFELGVRRDWLLYGEGEKELPKIRTAEMPHAYSRREKITWIEESAPELLPLVDAFFQNLEKQLGVARDGTRSRKIRRSSQ